VIKLCDVWLLAEWLYGIRLAVGCAVVLFGTCKFPFFLSARCDGIWHRFAFLIFGLQSHGGQIFDAAFEDLLRSYEVSIFSVVVKGLVGGDRGGDGFC
jgi:hypothetical protein